MDIVVFDPMTRLDTVVEAMRSISRSRTARGESPFTVSELINRFADVEEARAALALGIENKRLIYFDVGGPEFLVGANDVGSFRRARHG